MWPARLPRLARPPTMRLGPRSPSCRASPRLVVWLGASDLFCSPESDECGAAANPPRPLDEARSGRRTCFPSLSKLKSGGSAPTVPVSVATSRRGLRRRSQGLSGCSLWPSCGLPEAFGLSWRWVVRSYRIAAGSMRSAMQRRTGAAVRASAQRDYQCRATRCKDQRPVTASCKGLM